MQTTEQGAVYYVDHINKRTSWDPPMLSTGGMSVLPSAQPDIRESPLLYASRLSDEAESPTNTPNAPELYMVCEE